jgi:hypothetical protein
MLNISGLIVLHIIWDGPLTAAGAERATGANDYGVYQIYGTHSITGPDTLLYVGQTDRRTFGQRFPEHQNKWGRWEPSEISIYLGRLAGFGPISDVTWGKLIDRAEAALILKCTPAYNVARITGLPQKYRDQPTLIVNHGHRHRLPESISTMTEFINTDDRDLKCFGRPGHDVAPPEPVPEALDQ